MLQIKITKINPLKNNLNYNLYKGNNLFTNDRESQEQLSLLSSDAKPDCFDNILNEFLDGTRTNSYACRSKLK